MTATKFNYVYRLGAAAGSPVPSFYTCVSYIEVTSPNAGDIAYETSTLSFKKYDGFNWQSIGDTEDLEARVELLEFLVTAIIIKGFGGL